MEYSRNETLIEIGERIRNEREKKGLTQTALADKLKDLNIPISRQKIAKWETGIQAMQAEEIIEVANFFDVDCDYFIRGIKSDNVKTAKTTGLSNDTIEALKSFNTSIENKVIMRLINLLIEELYNNRYICGDICDLIENTNDYFSKIRSAPVKLRYASSAKEVHETAKEIADLSAAVNGGKYVLSEFFGKFLEKFRLLTNGISSDEAIRLKSDYLDIGQQVYKDGVNNGEHTGKTE